jgi:hypothetical protein
MIKQSTIYRTETAETFQNKYPTLQIKHSTFYLEENRNNFIIIDVLNAGDSTELIYKNTTLIYVADCEEFYKRTPQMNIISNIDKGNTYSNSINGLIHHMSENDFEEDIYPGTRQKFPEVTSTETREDIVEAFILRKTNTEYDHLDETQLNDLIDVLYKRKEVFRQDPTGLKRTNILTADIITEHEMPIKKRQYTASVRDKKAQGDIIKDLLKLGVIKHSNSPYNFPCMIVWKTKSSGEQSPRMVVDYRTLNEITRKDAYNLPLIANILKALHGVQFITCLDLTKYFHQKYLAHYQSNTMETNSKRLRLFTYQ